MILDKVKLQICERKVWQYHRNCEVYLCRLQLFRLLSRTAAMVRYHERDMTRRDEKARGSQTHDVQKHKHIKNICNTFHASWILRFWRSSGKRKKSEIAKAFSPISCLGCSTRENNGHETLHKTNYTNIFRFDAGFGARIRTTARDDPKQPTILRLARNTPPTTDDCGRNEQGNAKFFCDCPCCCWSRRWIRSWCSPYGNCLFGFGLDLFHSTWISSSPYLHLGSLRW